MRPIRMPFQVMLIAVALLALAAQEGRAGSDATGKTGKLAFYVSQQQKAGKIRAREIYPSRYQRPDFLGTSQPIQIYKGFTLIGGKFYGQDKPENSWFFRKIRQSIDLIERKSPNIYQMMRGINPNGRRVIAYTGRNGPASFVAWEKDYIVNITASNIDDDPAFENSSYTLSATLVHELLGHGRQENDGRVWAMYDWCGKSNGHIEGVVWQANVAGKSSGLVEYEANLFARWFLESVRGTYPDLNEVPIRRYVKIVRTMKKRFPGWYDERKDSTTLLGEFEGHFNRVCPGLQFTPHPVTGG